VNLDDGELTAVGQAAGRSISDDRRMIVGAGLRVWQRVDDREGPAGFEPASRESKERRGSVTLHVAQPEPDHEGVDRPIRLGPRVAEVDVGAQAVGEEALPGALERRLGGVV
jgi:hypothetical protein